MSESLQTDFYQSQYLQHFNNFVQQLKVIFPSDDTINILSTIESYSDEVKIARGQLFCSSIRDENFDLFLKGKIKVFSHKSEDTQTISESLFGTDFCLKNLLNNQPDEVKKVIWINLHTLCMISELLKSDELRDQEKVSMLNKVISKDGRDSESFGEKYDRILIDAPCSGLGALRRRPEARWRRTLSDLKELLPLQRELIDSAYAMLNPGGIIGFATCSPLLAETKGQVLDALYRHKDLVILNIESYSPSGRTGVNPDGTMQLWTHLDGSDSMFMALLSKTAE